MTQPHLQQTYAKLFTTRPETSVPSTETIIITLPKNIQAGQVIAELTSCSDNRLINIFQRLEKELLATFHFIGGGVCGYHGVSTVNADQVAVELPVGAREKAEKRLSNIPGVTIHL